MVAFSQVVPGPGHYYSVGEVDQKKVEVGNWGRGRGVDQVEVGNPLSGC